MRLCGEVDPYHEMGEHGFRSGLTGQSSQCGKNGGQLHRGGLCKRKEGWGLEAERADGAQNMMGIAAEFILEV